MTSYLLFIIALCLIGLYWKDGLYGLRYFGREVDFSTMTLAKVISLFRGISGKILSLYHKF
ncbi:MAG TPA: hypothetical protein DHU85_06870 [Porphyromonadaceae bacterium]|nr:hypothetical protein [Porphyromonadaceae bacterium]